MEITAREAARRMQERHRLSRDVARRVLASGLAGPGRRVSGAVLFDEESVKALLDRRMCERWLLDRYKPLIVRLGRKRELEPPALWWGDLEATWLPIRNGPTWSLWDERYTRPRLDPLRADPDRQIRDWEIADRTTSTWALRAAAARAARPPDPR